jgi:hypothetical protein
MPEGSGGATPTIVTPRVGGGDDDLADDNGQETQPAGIRAAVPRRRPAKTAKADPVTATSANGNGSDRAARSAAGTADAAAVESATNGVRDVSFPASSTETVPSTTPGHADGTVSDATIVDGVPALPADEPGPSGDSRPKDAAGALASPDRDTDQPPAAEKAPAADPLPLPPLGTSPSGILASTIFASGTAASSSTASSSTSPSTASSTTSAPSTSASSTAPASPEAPTVSPAAFAWDMPDLPPNSPSSPARSFLRSGTSTRTPAAAPGPPATVSAGKAAPGEPPVASRSAQKKATKRSARQAHLTVAKVEPWSVMKVSFIVSLVAFVVLFVAVSVLYGALAGLGVFDSLQRVVSSVTSSQSSAGVNAAKWWSASRILGYTALLGSLNIVLITAMSTIGAVVYNLTSRLVGGVEVTLRETE